MFKLEFDAANKPLAAAIGAALAAYGRGETATISPAPPAAVASTLTDEERDALDDQSGPSDLDDATANLCETCTQTYARALVECPHCADTGTLEDDIESAEAGFKSTCPQCTTTAEGECAPDCPTRKSDPAPDARIDTNSVPFDAAFCGEAKEPFYASGKQAGQWKKKRGVTDDEYGTWYTEQLALRTAAADTGEPAGPDTTSTAAAFKPAGPAGPGTAAPAAPTDCGTFMAWVSELQAAERLTQDDIGAAYTACNLAMTDLFPPNDETTVANVAKLYANLSAVAGQ